MHSYNEVQLDHNRSEIHALDTSDKRHMSNSLMESYKRRVESSFQSCPHCNPSPDIALQKRSTRQPRLFHLNSLSISRWLTTPAWVFLHATKEDVERILQGKAPDVTAAKPMSIILEKPDGVWSNERIRSKSLLGRLMLVRKLSTPVRYEQPWHWS